MQSRGIELVVMCMVRPLIMRFYAGPVRDLFRVLEVVNNRLRTLDEVIFHRPLLPVLLAK